MHRCFRTGPTPPPLIPKYLDPMYMYMYPNYALLKLSIILVIGDDASYMFVLGNTIPTDNKTAYMCGIF